MHSQYKTLSFTEYLYHSIACTFAGMRLHFLQACSKYKCSKELVAKLISYVFNVLQNQKHHPL